MALRIPISTYRLQFNSGFKFCDACVLVPYLHDLGITDLYASPLLQAKRGSTHGYDVTDPSHLNPELGTEVDFDALVAELKKYGMGLLLDIVPNHMSASSENPWWMDVLENGSHSQYALHFDVDWHPPSRALENRVLLPILGKPYAEVLEGGELVLSFDAGIFFLNYSDFRLPISPRTYLQILEYQSDRLQHKRGLDSAALVEFQGLLSGLQQLASAPQEITLDRRQIQEIKGRLGRLYSKVVEIKQFVDDNLRAFNGKKGSSESFMLLDRLMSKQAYVLAYWKTENQAINYRRFFTISDLVGVRIGDPVTFEASHALVIRLAEKGQVTGFRIDHIDGLRDPKDYLERLQDRLRVEGSDPKQLPFYILLEKICSSDEHLDKNWPVQGTTGYDYMNAVNELFIDQQGLVELQTSYRKYVNSETPYTDLVYFKKKQVMATILSPEILSLSYHLGLLALQDRYAREIPRELLTRALIEITACFPVYRTYLRDFEVSDSDKYFIEIALTEARRRNPNLDPKAFAWLEEILLLKPAGHVLPEQREQRLSFVMTWQQLTGPITAKGVEDSALYVYNSLISLNEVGGNPAGPGNLPSEFHDYLQKKAATWPFAMNATMTHDAKHAEDFRARVNVLSELPADWNINLKQWNEWNRKKRSKVGTQLLPLPNEEELIYQALLGSWPIHEALGDSYVQRIQDFVVKAGREAMVHTRWAIPNLPYEKAITDFVAVILNPSEDNLFLKNFPEFAARIAFHGALNSLSQLLIKIASPGIPDFYQGSEIFDLRLVDPDNRQQVDFAVRAAQQKKIVAGTVTIAEVLADWKSGMIKQFVARRALRFRRENHDLFLKGQYHPLKVQGAHQDSVFAFAREFNHSWALIIAPRLTTRITTAPNMPLGKIAWSDTSIHLPKEFPRQWKNLFTQAVCEPEKEKESELAVSKVFRDFPVAILIGSR